MHVLHHDDITLYRHFHNWWLQFVCPASWEWTTLALSAKSGTMMALTSGLDVVIIGQVKQGRLMHDEHGADTLEEVAQGIADLECDQLASIITRELM